MRTYLCMIQIRLRILQKSTKSFCLLNIEDLQAYFSGLLLSFHVLVVIVVYRCQPDRWSNELSVRQWSGRPGFNPRLSHTKDSKNGT